MFWSFRHHVRGTLGEYKIVSPQDWRDSADGAFGLRDYELLDPIKARFALADIAGTSHGLQVLRDVAQEVLPYFYSVHPPAGSYEEAAEDARRLEKLEQALGFCSDEPDTPPSFASFYICRRKQRAHTDKLPDPWSGVREAIEAAKAAPRGYVTIEALDENDQPLPHVRLELLLADGEVITRSTDATGRLHVEPIPRGRCTVKVPGIDGAAWRPSTGSSSFLFRQYKQTHVVRRGERLGHIARQYGFYDWKKLWHASENDALREKRKEPQWIRPGDEVLIPGIEVHHVEWPTDQFHRIVLKERPDEASVFVVSPYTKDDLDRGVDAELTLSGPKYSRTLTVAADHTPVSDYFEVHFVELEFKGVPTSDRYCLKIKPQGEEEHTVFEDVPFAELMDEGCLDASSERSNEVA